MFLFNIISVMTTKVINMKILNLLSKIGLYTIATLGFSSNSVAYDGKSNIWNEHITLSKYVVQQDCAGYSITGGYNSNSTKVSKGMLGGDIMSGWKELRVALECSIGGLGYDFDTPAVMFAIDGGPLEYNEKLVNAGLNHTNSQQFILGNVPKNVVGGKDITFKNGGEVAAVLKPFFEKKHGAALRVYADTGKATTKSSGITFQRNPFEIKQTLYRQMANDDRVYARPLHELEEERVKKLFREGFPDLYPKAAPPAPAVGRVYARPLHELEEERVKKLFREGSPDLYPKAAAPATK
jgi:hypothetical protein